MLKLSLWLDSLKVDGALGETRTPDLDLGVDPLYPTELPAHSVRSGVQDPTERCSLWCYQRAPEQSRRFIDMAREIEADETPGALDQVFNKVYPRQSAQIPSGLPKGQNSKKFEGQ